MTSEYRATRGSLPGAAQYEIMLVDDDEHMRDAIRVLLEERGYEVVSCADCSSAIEWLRSGRLPDLIVLDLIMPGMDGWQFRVEQKREPRWSAIPVIVLSADLSAKAEAIDARAYVPKPFEPSVLVAHVEQILAELESEREKARAGELDRLSSLGALAGGIAHEINNPLSFVLGNLELAERQANELAARLTGRDAFSMVGLLQVLSRAQRGAERIASVVRGVSMFATANTESVLAIDVHEVLESSLQVASNEIRHCAKLERSYGALSSVRGNPAKLGQVFLNLLLNAVRAVRAAPQDRKHVIHVGTAMDEGGNVVVTVADTGRGISSSMQARTFDPFSVTRGAAAGLGLAVSREIVESMGGSIEFVSDLQIGSTFRVVLPSQAKGRSTVPPPLPDRVERERSRRTRVLIVDDEPLMCEMLSAVLSGDYDVATFTDPRAGLASMLEGSFDVILCDLMMPDLTGMDLYEALHKERPELCERMVFISGGAFTERARSFLATTRRPQIKKPFRREELVEAIEDRLHTKH
jgi:signal transduction histidine kinase